MSINLNIDNRCRFLATQNDLVLLVWVFLTGFLARVYLLLLCTLWLFVLPVVVVTVVFFVLFVCSDFVVCS